MDASMKKLSQWDATRGDGWRASLLPLWTQSAGQVSAGYKPMTQFQPEGPANEAGYSCGGKGRNSPEHDLATS